MRIQRMLRVAVALGLMLGASLVLPQAADAGKPSHSAKKGGGHKTKGRVAARHSSSSRRRVRGKFAGHLAPLSSLRIEPLPRPSGHIVVRSANLREEADVNIFNEDGTYNQAALAKLDHVFRCRRTQEERAIDPRLLEILSIIYDKYSQPIELTSGFRYQRNEGSRHFHGSAMDITVPGVRMDELYTFAQTLDVGGMGIGRYPHNGFVHVDFRAPGEASFRWTDTKRTRNDPGHKPSKMWKRSTRPNT